jgi:hypothetical protein
MRSTPPPPPLSQRASSDVLEELCLALRDLGIATRFLPWGPPPDIDNEVNRVRVLSTELRSRRVDPETRLSTLTGETGWLMNALLAESMEFPKVRPWVRDQRSGLRIALRCAVCTRREFPEDSQLIRLCSDCLREFKNALATPMALDHMLLYRTYSPQARCEHAGDDTVLGVYPWSSEWSADFPVGFCSVCVENEERRRNAG